MSKKKKNKKKNKSVNVSNKVEDTKNDSIESSEVKAEEETETIKNVQNEESDTNSADNQQLNGPAELQDEPGSESEIPENKELPLETPTVAETKTETANNLISLLKSNRKNTYIGIGTAIGIFVLCLIMLIIPAIRYKNGVQKYVDGKYEEAYQLLSKNKNYKDSEDFIKATEFSLVADTTTYIVDTEGKYNNDQLKLQTVDNFEIDINGNTETLSYSAILSNKKYELYQSYNVSKEKNENKWNVVDYEVTSSEIVPIIKCDENIAKEKVETEFMDVELLEQENIDNTTIRFTYLYKNEDKPLYISSYHVYATYKFDEYFGRWDFDSLDHEIVETNKIDEYNTYNSSYIDIDLPSEWDFTCHESDHSMNYYWNYDNKTSDYKNCLSIHIYEIDKYNKTDDYAEEPTANNGLGYGNYTVEDGVSYLAKYYPENNTRIDAYYYPLIDGTYRKLTIETIGISETDFKELLSTLKLVRRSYTVKVTNADSINIRNDPNTYYSEVVGQARKGKTYTATAITISGNYTWYKIGDEQWIANDGTWLDVTTK